MSASGGRAFNVRAGAYGVVAALALFLAYDFGSQTHQCMSFGWGLYGVALVFGLLLFYPIFWLGTLIGGTCIFFLAGGAARFITFRAAPTLVFFALGLLVLWYIGFALSEPSGACSAI
jgi:hypothetical protein